MTGVHGAVRRHRAGGAAMTRVHGAVRGIGQAVLA
jgi:hypothetical protein